MSGVLTKRGNLNTETETQGEHQMEAGVTLSQAKEHQRLGIIHQKLGEGHGTDSLSQPSEGTNPADTLISDFLSPEL